MNKVEKEQSENLLQVSEKLTLIDGRDGKAWNAYQAIDQHRKFGQETWKILLAVVLGLIVMEMLLLEDLEDGTRSPSSTASVYSGWVIGPWAKPLA